MRHLKKNNHLSRTRAHRRAMLANMASSLIIHKRIHTTLAKAKALRTYVEPLITRSKDDSTHSRRVVFGHLQNKEALTELFREVSPRVFSRPGGYTRIIKIGNRLGDNAEMCMIELVDYNEHLLAEAQDAKSKSTRRGGRRRGGKKKTETAKTEVKADQVKEEKQQAETEEMFVEKKETESKLPEEKKAEESLEKKVDENTEKKSNTQAKEVKSETPEKKEEAKQDPKAEKKEAVEPEEMQEKKDDKKEEDK